MTNNCKQPFMTRFSACRHWLLCLLLVACQGKQTPSSESQGGDSDAFVEEEILYNDTIEGEKVSQDCAAMSYNLDEIISQLEAVQSPSMLMKVKYDYPNLLYRATQEIDQLPAEEKAVMQKKLKRIQTLYAETCSTYEVEPSGIISNLQNLINKLPQIKTQQAFDDFCSNRYGVINNLDKIHLSTHDQSLQIKEIKKLARQLHSMLQAKKKELGIDH
ncbi:MAG: hypothetical protein IJ901_11420 [Bacteroidaceae bacterium]|nr:hypothetical protein [Bacteroidaceae bacterium]